MSSSKRRQGGPRDAHCVNIILLQGEYSVADS